MKLLRCDNGHFYDGGKSTSCPHCRRLARSHKNNTMPEIIVPERDYSESELTVPIFSSAESKTDVGNVSVESNFQVNTEAKNDVFIESHSDAFSVGNGFSYGSVTEIVEDDKTQGILNCDASSVINPNSVHDDHALTAGWLICIKGVNKGCDYKIHIGRNTIGRGEDNTITILGDNTVSKEEQVILIYDPSKNKFFALAGRSHSLSYLNGELLLSKAEMKKNDILELEETHLMLIPCCDEDFDWSKVSD